MSSIASYRALLVALPLSFVAATVAARPPTSSPRRPVPKSAAALTPPARLWTELSAAARAGKLPSPPPFDQLARRVGPAVVSITASPRAIEGGPSRPRASGVSQGTGFFIHPLGYILTNHHVVADAAEVRVVIEGERELGARVVGSDPKTDLALLRVDGTGPFQVAPLGDSDRVATGEWVMAIGNPFGLDHTVTVGIVSGKGRHDLRPGGIEGGLHDFIQTDASINVGNSGGPLLNARGEVVGINTAMKAEAQGIAFAIPINMAKAIVPALVEHGRVRRAWLGAVAQPITPALARAMDLEGVRGALVAQVVAGSPAAIAGLAEGDVVLALDGAPIRLAADLDFRVATWGIGRRLDVTVRRRGQERVIPVMPIADPNDAPLSPLDGPTRPDAPRSSLGVTVSAIDASLAHDLGVRSGAPLPDGVVVTLIEPGSPAAESGLEAHDRVLRVGDEDVRTLDDYAHAVRLIRAGAVIRLQVERTGGKRLWFAFEKR